MCCATKRPGRASGCGSISTDHRLVSSNVLQRHRHDAGLAVDIDAAEELHPEAGREILAVAAF